jgi:hypothetical protein
MAYHPRRFAWRREYMAQTQPNLPSHNLNPAESTAGSARELGGDGTEHTFVCRISQHDRTSTKYTSFPDPNMITDRAIDPKKARRPNGDPA